MSDRSRLLGVVSATSSTHILPTFDYTGVTRSQDGDGPLWASKSFSETYGWRLEHYVHVFLQSMGRTQCLSLLLFTQPPNQWRKGRDKYHTDQSSYFYNNRTTIEKLILLVSFCFFMLRNILQNEILVIRYYRGYSTS